ncbi:MAG TPA: hypothetical protein VI503_03420 [Gaiellaceae bacterium]|nr:hypothetical protein [Gaiellaceae bacterium]
MIAATLGLAATAAAGRLAIVPVDVDGVPDATCSDLGIDLEFGLHGTLVVIETGSGTEIQAAPDFTISWSANGKTLTSRGPAPPLRHLRPDGSIAQTEVPGLLVAVTFPGSGVIWLWTGVTVYEGAVFSPDVLVSHGPNGFRSEGDLMAFCGYFEE